MWGRYNDASSHSKNEGSAPKIKNKIIPLSPRGESFKEELLSKIVPWEKITVSLDNFPYYIEEDTKIHLMECLSSHLKQRKLGKYIGGLNSSSDRILLQSMPGTRQYLERLVSAFARELQVPLLKVHNDRDYDDKQVNRDDEDHRPWNEEVTYKKGDRVMYCGETISVDGVFNRILSSGQRGEVYEVDDDDRVAVVFNICSMKTKEAEKDVKNTETSRHALVTWLDVNYVRQDEDAQTHDFFIAMEALYEVLSTFQQPLIVYFPDSRLGLSDVVYYSPYSETSKELHGKVKRIFNQLPEGVVMICAQGINIPRRWEDVSDGMKNSHESLRKYIKWLEIPHHYYVPDMSKLFTNVIYIQPPKDQNLVNRFIKQIEEDRLTMISECNLTTVHKVLKAHNLACMNMEQEDFEDMMLTRQRVEKILGWAANHYLSSCDLPCVKEEKLQIPLESIKLAILRLKHEEPQSKKQSYPLKEVEVAEEVSEYKKKLQRIQDLASSYLEERFVPAVLLSEYSGLTFDDVGALESVKKVLYETVVLPMRRPELFSHGNLLRPCKGLLLYGPPGTGKALLAKALATESGADFINVKTATLTAKQQGESSENLTRALFSYARKLAPVIMFVDEDESLLGARGHNKYDTIRLNEFLAAWDGLNWKESERILVIGATNRPFDLDEAVIRRMPRRIYVGLPDVETRSKILKILLSKENLESGFSFEQLAEATQGYSGSDLKKLCIAAAYRPIEEFLQQESKGEVAALRSLNLNDFLHSKDKVRPSVEYDASSILKIREWNEQYGEGETQTRHV